MDNWSIFGCSSLWQFSRLLTLLGSSCPAPVRLSYPGLLQNSYEGDVHNWSSWLCLDSGGAPPLQDQREPADEPDGQNSSLKSTARRCLHSVNDRGNSESRGSTVSYLDTGCCRIGSSSGNGFLACLFGQTVRDLLLVPNLSRLLRAHPKLRIEYSPHVHWFLYYNCRRNDGTSAT